MQPTTSIAIIEAGRGGDGAYEHYGYGERGGTGRLTVVPLVLRTRREGEREQDERDARADEQQPNNVQLLGERPRAPAKRRVLRLGGRGDEPEALRLLLGPEEGDDEGRERGGDEDREHAVAPAPAGPVEDLGRDVGADEGVDDEGRGGEARN